jgi:hypothetical protein
MDLRERVGLKGALPQPRYARLSGEANQPSGARPSKGTIFQESFGASMLAGHLLSEVTPKRTRKVSKMQDDSEVYEESLICLPKSQGTKTRGD